MSSGDFRMDVQSQVLSDRTSSRTPPPPCISLGILGLSFIKHVTSVFLFQWYTQISHRISFQKCHITDQNRQIYMYYYKIFCIPKSSMLKRRLLLCEQIVKTEVWTLLGIRISTSGIVKFSILVEACLQKSFVNLSITALPPGMQES